nr:hypothetical protein Iba_chr04aCG6450 [Ipomoea batatas]
MDSKKDADKLNMDEITDFLLRVLLKRRDMKEKIVRNVGKGLRQREYAKWATYTVTQ